MSDDRAAAVRERFTAGLEAFNRGDLEGGTVAFAEDCRYQIQRSHPEARVCVGREEIRRYQEEWFRQLEDIHYDVSDILVRWPYALVGGRIRGRGAGSGLELDVELGIVYELNDQIEAVSAEEFLDLAEAERAFEQRSTAATTQ